MKEEFREQKGFRALQPVMPYCLKDTDCKVFTLFQELAQGSRGTPRSMRLLTFKLIVRW